MKKYMLGLVAIMAILLSACQPASNEREDRELVVATAGDVKPFSYEDKGELTGYDIEVLKAVDKKLDKVHFSYQRTNWESIFAGLDAGRYQIAANNLSYTKERAKKYLYSLPIAQNPLVLVSRSDQPISSLSEIGGRKTEDDTGTSTAQLIEDWNKGHRENPAVLDYSGEDIGKRLLDLDNKEMDFLIFDKVTVQSLIQERGYSFHLVELEGDSNPNNYLIFAKGEEGFQKEFNQALKELLEDGTLERLSQTYLKGDYLVKEK
ncbi:amino acid ABC transporter substrate-binding protein [Streptococcus himalayensis]|uniref:Amino acid ABC transporter substrate-binding protein n=1 Tax=Streptococcus himalayensis TaxID=1888195 RepID=A0A917EHE6_9STRE|nr:amino acid ABC transporter substrate-binding protein [Streptococcus himalayensis]GGE36558.1 amino acid ABC transporter substrate-binding protein [Streptococcus himalayensis]